MEKIKPCPCGGVPKVYGWKRGCGYGTIIRCDSCGTYISEYAKDCNDCHDRAVKKWNRRANETILIERTE